MMKYMFDEDLKKMVYRYIDPDDLYTLVSVLTPNGWETVDVELTEEQKARCKEVYEKIPDAVPARMQDLYKRFKDSRGSVQITMLGEMRRLIDLQDRGFDTTILPMTDEQFVDWLVELDKGD